MDSQQHMRQILPNTFCFRCSMLQGLGVSRCDTTGAMGRVLLIKLMYKTVCAYVRACVRVCVCVCVRARSCVCGNHRLARALIILSLWYPSTRHNGDKSRHSSTRVFRKPRSLCYTRAAQRIGLRPGHSRATPPPGVCRAPHGPWSHGSLAPRCAAGLGDSR